MNLRNFLILYVVVAIFSINIFCSPWSMSISTGIIRNTQPDVEDLNKYAIFSEIQIERTIVYVTKDINWISSAIYFAWWDDFQDTETKAFEDYATYSQQFYKIGTRVFLNSRSENISWALFCGISQNYISFDYIGGYTIDGNPGEDHIKKKYLYNFGINIGLPIAPNINAGIGGIFEFSTNNEFEANPRIGCRVNLHYDFKLK